MQSSINHSPWGMLHAVWRVPNWYGNIGRGLEVTGIEIDRTTIYEKEPKIEKRLCVTTNITMLCNSPQFIYFIVSHNLHTLINLQNKLCVCQCVVLIECVLCDCLVMDLSWINKSDTTLLSNPISKPWLNILAFLESRQVEMIREPLI